MGIPDQKKYSGLVIGGPMDGSSYAHTAPSFSIHVRPPTSLLVGAMVPDDGPKEVVDIVTYVWNPVYISSDGSEEISAWVPSKQSRAETIRMLMEEYASRPRRD